MKNIQVIDAAVNCTYDIFHAQDNQFDLIFPNGTDVEFIEDFIERIGEGAADAVLNAIWKCRADKKVVQGVHGTLFYGLEEKKPFYPTKKEEEMIANPPRASEWGKSTRQARF